MWRKFKRWRWVALLVGVLTTGVAYSLWPQPVLVDIGTVSVGPMSVGITDDGITREEELYVVSAPVTGYVSRIRLKAGDKVTKGQIIADMTSRPSAPLDQRTEEELRNTLVAAEAAVQSAIASLAQAERDVTRAEALAKNGFVTKVQLEVVRTRVTTERTGLRQRRAEVARINALLSEPGAIATGKIVRVRAPITGTVLIVPNQSEGVILEGTHLITIGDPAKIELVIDLLSREAVKVSPGDRALITQWGGPQPLTGTVKRVEPVGHLKISALGIEEQRVNVIIGFDAVTAGSAARLGHGYQVDATIILWNKPDALRVPINALVRSKDEDWHVFLVDGRRARERVVRIGHVNDDQGEVLSGLRAGDHVVLNPGNSLVDGIRINPR